MKSKFLLFFFLIASFYVFGQGQQNLNTSIEQIFKQYNLDDVPGVAVGVVKNGKLIHSSGFGMANYDSKALISEHTIFNIGSVSKQFTVYAILLLEQDGLLNVNDDVRKYIPELHKFDTPVTLEHLIQHTSGYNDVGFLAKMAGWRQTDLFTHEQMLKLAMKQTSLEFAPGSRFKYTNTGTCLLAEVVSRISNQSFADFMRKRVFLPLHMNNTFIREDHTLVIDNLAYNYYYEHGKLRKGMNPNSALGYTNVYSSLKDMSKWAIHYLHPDGALVPIIEKMNAPTILNNGKKEIHAHGQFLTPYKGYKQIQHTGSHRGYLSYLGHFPEEDMSIILCSNRADFNLFDSAYKIADLFLRSEKEVVKKVNNSKKKKTKLLSKKQLKKWVGNYRNTSNGGLKKITLERDTLMYVNERNAKTPLLPIGPESFLFGNSESSLLLRFSSGKTQNQIQFFENGYPEEILVQYIPRTYSTEELKQFEGIYYSKDLNESYVFKVIEGVLTAENRKLKIVSFKSVGEDIFSSDKWYFKDIIFKRNGKVITGLTASSIRVSNIEFLKVKFEP